MHLLGNYKDTKFHILQSTGCIFIPAEQRLATHGPQTRSVKWLNQACRAGTIISNSAVRRVAVTSLYPWTLFLQYCLLSPYPSLLSFTPLSCSCLLSSPNLLLVAAGASSQGVAPAECKSKGAALGTEQGQQGPAFRARYLISAQCSLKVSDSCCTAWTDSTNAKLSLKNKKRLSCQNKKNNLPNLNRAKTKAVVSFGVGK